MPSLLSLPYELRGRIIDFVIWSSRPLPEGRGASSPPRIEPDDIEYRYAWRAKGTKYESDPSVYVPNARGLILTNHQLHAETVGRMASVDYDLDIMVVDEAELWPSWLRLPSVVCRRVDTVRVSIRTVGSPPPRRSMFQPGDGGPAQMAWSFFSLLERFLRLGPVAPGHPHGPESRMKSTDRGLSIRNLELDVRPPGRIPARYKLAAPDQRLVRPGTPRRDRRGEKNLIMHPQEVAEFLCDMIQALTDMSYYTAAHGAVLFERVGRIQVRVDGQPPREWCLAEILADFPADHPPPASYQTLRNPKLAHFPTWREHAWSRRARFGLPVIRDQDRARTQNR